MILNWFFMPSLFCQYRISKNSLEYTEASKKLRVVQSG